MQQWSRKFNDYDPLAEPVSGDRARSGGGSADDSDGSSLRAGSGQEQTPVETAAAASNGRAAVDSSASSSTNSSSNGRPAAPINLTAYDGSSNGVSHALTPAILTHEPQRQPQPHHVTAHLDHSRTAAAARPAPLGGVYEVRVRARGMALRPGKVMATAMCSRYVWVAADEAV